MTTLPPHNPVIEAMIDTIRARRQELLTMFGRNKEEHADAINEYVALGHKLKDLRKNIRITSPWRHY